MKALSFRSFGSPDVLELVDKPVPQPGAGEALVEIHASAINPSDVRILSGLFEPSLPRTPGRDYAGVVVSEGAWHGKAVWGTGADFGISRDGAHAEYAVVPESWLSEKPSRLTMEQAASVGVPYIAAWSALVTAMALQAGETILVTGALGAVGRAATQIAHLRGAKVIGADITDRPSEANMFINSRDVDLADAVRKLTDGKGVDAVLDTVGGPVFEPGLKSLALGGRQAVITSVGSRRVEFDLIDFYHNRLRLIGVDTAKLSGEEIAGIMNGLRDGFEAGVLMPSDIRPWPLGVGRQAYQAVAAGGLSAKQVLSPRA